MSSFSHFWYIGPFSRAVIINKILWIHLAFHLITLYLHIFGNKYCDENQETFICLSQHKKCLKLNKIFSAYIKDPPYTLRSGNIQFFRKGKSEEKNFCQQVFNGKIFMQKCGSRLFPIHYKGLYFQLSSPFILIYDTNSL